MTSPKSGVGKEQGSEDNPTTSESGASTSNPIAAGTTVVSPSETYDFRPKLTSERWRDGIYSMETSTLSPLLFINERDLLSEDQKRERLAYTVYFKARLDYDREEKRIFEMDFEKMRKIFEAREKRIGDMQQPDQGEGRDVEEGEARGGEADDSVFKKPLPPGSSTRKPESQEKPKKGPGKKGSGSKDSSSESGTKAKKGSGSKDSSGSESGTKSTRVKKLSSSSSDADTPGPKTRSSSRQKR